MLLRGAGQMFANDVRASSKTERNRSGGRRLDHGHSTTDLLVNDDVGALPRPRQSYCWLYTALTVFAIVVCTILLVHFKDRITSGAGSTLQPTEYENFIGQNTTSPVTFFNNVGVGSGNARLEMNKGEVQLLHALFRNDTHAVKTLLTGGDTGFSFAPGHSLLFDNGKPMDRDAILKALISVLPTIVKFLGGHSSPMVRALHFLIHTDELMPIVASVVGWDGVQQILDAL